MINELTEHPKSQMTSVTDNSINNNDGCVSFCACNRTWIERCSSQSGSDVMVPMMIGSKEEMQQKDIDMKIVYLCVRGDRGEKAISEE